MRLLGLILLFALCANAQAQIFTPPFFNRLQGDVVTTNTTNATSASASTHNITISTGDGGVVAVAVSYRSGGTGRTITSVNICGTSATQQVQQDNAAAGTTVRAEIWSAPGVTSSASCTLTVTASLAGVLGVSVYQLANVSSATPTDTQKTTGTTAPTVTVTYLAGGAIIGVTSSELAAGGVTTTWSGTAGIVEDADAITDVGNGAAYSTAHKDEASAASGTVIATYLAPVTAGSLAAAAFR